MESTTATPLDVADKARDEYKRASTQRTGLARAIADMLCAGMSVPPAVRQEYTMACVAVAAAEDMYLEAVDALALRDSEAAESRAAAS